MAGIQIARDGDDCIMSIKLPTVLLLLLIASMSMSNCYAQEFSGMSLMRMVELNLNVFDGNTGADLTFYQMNLTIPDGWGKEYLIDRPNEALFVPYDEREVTVTVTCEGYEKSMKIMTLDKNKTIAFYLNLIDPSMVYVHVKNIENQLVKYADVNVTALYGNESLTGKTNNNGVFSFMTRLENFRVDISAKGYKPFEDEITVPYNGGERFYDVKLEYLNTAKITIEVKDRAFNPIRNAKVTFISRYGSITNITNESGLAKFKIPCENYTIKVAKESYQLCQDFLDLSKPVVGGKTIQLTNLSQKERLLTWYQQNRKVIVCVTLFCIAIFLVLKMKRKHKKT